MTGKVPCDSGYAWVVMLGTSICMFFVVGMFRSQGILFVEFIHAFGSSQAVSAWMVGVTAGGLSLISPIANHFAVKYSSRVVVMVGTILVSCGALMTAWAPNIYFVICVFGGLTGCGYSCMFGPSLMMIGLYFEKRRSFANATALAGASLGCLVIPPVMTRLIEQYTVWGALILYSAFVLHGCVAALLLRPPSFYHNESFKAVCKDVVSSTNTTKSVVSEVYNSALYNDVKAIQHDDISLQSQSINIINVSCKYPDSRPKQIVLTHVGDQQLSQSQSLLNSPVGERLLQSHVSSISNPQLDKTQLQFPLPLTSSMNTLDVKKNTAALQTKPCIQNKNLLFLKQVDDHYTSKESLFIVEGQAIPDKMVQEEVQLQHTESQRKSVTSLQTNASCADVPICRSICHIFHWDHFTNPLFVLFSISVGIGNSAYVDHFIVVPPHCEDIGLSKEQAALLLSIAGALDIVGRLLSGWFADLNLIARWRIMSVAMMITGTSTTICSFFKVFPALIVLCAVLGFVSGVQVSLFTVVLVDFVGLKKFPGAFGIFMLFLGVFNAGLPSFLGYLRDVTGSHQISFLVIGVLMVLSGAVLWLEPCARKIMDAQQHHITTTK